MAHVRRTRYAFYYCEDSDFLDLPRLLRGEARVAPLRQIIAISILTGLEHAVTKDEFDVLLSIPSETWVEADAAGTDAESLGRLARNGLLVTDEPDPRLRELRARDVQLAADGWNVHAALYHFMTKWRDVDDAPQLEVADCDAEGLPPAPFHSVPHDTSRLVNLPLHFEDRSVYDILRRRRTVRAFDTQKTMSCDDLSSLLRHTFGCHASLRLGTLVALRKTSPSGGALHPTEVYPLIRNVEGIPPGVYHYSVEKHALEPMETLTAVEVAALATTFAAGQLFPADAHATFVLTTRFYRSFWKYRRHKRAYAVLLMDVGHLSQTFYLVCAELQLGPFVTAAINGANIEERLALDPFREGAIALCGCGVPLEDGHDVPSFVPYVPRATQLTSPPDLA
jgi:putative peptide maturation dehydrogenase